MQVDGLDGPLRSRIVDTADRQSYKDRVDLPPRSAAVLIPAR